MSTVQHIHHNNDDLTVVNAARVSFDKQSAYLTEQDERLIRFLADHNHWSPLAHPHYAFVFHKSWGPDLWRFMAYRSAGFAIENDDNGDIKITGSLYAWVQNRLLLPVEIAMKVCDLLTDRAPTSMGALDAEEWELQEHPAGMSAVDADVHTFRITAPIFVARQLVKHQQNLIWNETSRRYVKGDPEFHYPEVWRRGSKDIKQGSLSDAADWQPHRLYRLFCWIAKQFYKRMLKKGICAEQARMVLPTSMMTSWWWTGTSEAFWRIVHLRCKPDAQRETKEIAEAIRAHLKEART